MNTERPVVVICSTVIVLAVLGVYGYQSLSHVDTSQTLTLVIGALAAAPGVASYARAGSISREVGVVKEQTNGNTSRLHDMLEKVLTAQQPAAVDPQPVATPAPAEQPAPVPVTPVPAPVGATPPA